MPKNDLAASLNALEPGATLPVIGRCHECKSAVRLDVAAITYLADDDPHANLPSDHYTDARSSRRWVGTAFYLKNWDAVNTCPCGGWIEYRGINYKHSPNTSCSSACTTATGWDCKCSCGGGNHGVDAGNAR